MKQLSSVLFFLSLSSFCFSQSNLTFHSYSGSTILGDTIDYSVFAGKKILVVNTASYCGYTFELGDLQALYEQYGGPDFTIVGFPCNDFANQDPANDSTINAFCKANYNVTFPMMSKIHTVTGDTAGVYKWLQRKNLNGVSDASVIWNFNKFLVDEAGHWVAYFPQTTLPFDTAIVNWINQPSISTGVSLVSSSSVHLISANPVSNQLSLNLMNPKAENISVNLFSINGKKVAEIYNGNLEEQQVVNYNTEGITSGIYLMRVQSSATLQTLKVVVSH